MIFLFYFFKIHEMINYCPAKQGGRLQRRVGTVLSPGVPTTLSRFARLVGTPGYSEVSLPAEIHLITKVSPISYSCHYYIEYHRIAEDLKIFNRTLLEMIKFFKDKNAIKRARGGRASLLKLN